MLKKNIPIFKIPYLILYAIFISLLPHSAFAEIKTFVKEYTYQASEDDSRNSSRTISLREVKRLLLEELGTYLESVTEVQSFQLKKDQITTLTAGIVQTEIIEEKWDGKTYWLKSKIQVDSNEVIKSMDILRRDRQKMKELEEVRRRSDELLKENERLRKELTAEKGEKSQDKIAAYNETIKALTATAQFEKWLYYWQQGNASMNSGNYNNAVDAFSKGIQLRPEDDVLYINRAYVYEKLDNYSQALKDYDKAIELNPKNSAAYNNRGLAYKNLSNFNQAINDYNKAIELEPKWANPYYIRGIAYDEIGNHRQALEDFKTAAKLGHEEAKDYLRSKGISW